VQWLLKDSKMLCSNARKVLFGLSMVQDTAPIIVVYFTSPAYNHDAIEKASFVRDHVDFGPSHT
jgi:hypothetical protein